jgi:Ras GTPase-activating-like protein IQGAP2/3
MATLNPFVENNKARINQFLNSLCEVGDFYDTLEVRSWPRLVTVGWGVIVPR